MNSAEMLLQNISGEIDRRLSVAEHGACGSNVGNWNNGAVVLGITDNSHIAVAQVFERSSIDINVLDACGVHKHFHCHFQPPRTAREYSTPARGAQAREICKGLKKVASDVTLSMCSVLGTHSSFLKFDRRGQTRAS